MEVSTNDTANGDVSVAAAAAINLTKTESKATVIAGSDIVAIGDLRVQSSHNADIASDASADAVGAGVGVGVAAAVNLPHKLNSARIEAATIDAAGLRVAAEMTNKSGDTLNEFSATSLAGAGATDVGVAGSVAINILRMNVS